MRRHRLGAPLPVERGERVAEGVCVAFVVYGGRVDVVVERVDAVGGCVLIVGHPSLAVVVVVFLR